MNAECGPVEIPDGWNYVQVDGYEKLIRPGALEDSCLGMMWQSDAVINVTSHSAGVLRPGTLALTVRMDRPLEAGVYYARCLDRILEEEQRPDGQTMSVSEFCGLAREFLEDEAPHIWGRE